MVILVFRAIAEGQFQRLGLVMPIRDRSGTGGQGIFFNIAGMGLGGNAHQEMIRIDQMLAVCLGLGLFLFIREFVRMVLFHQGLIPRTQVLLCGAGHGV